MSKRLDMLLLEKNTYENSNDNEFLQQRELKSIADAILLELVDENHLDAKEKEAFEWAKKTIKGM